MIFASCIGIFAIPALYVTFQAVRERVKGIGKGGGSAPTVEASPQSEPSAHAAE
jgi:hypothetical protein